MVSFGRDTFERGDWLRERFYVSRSLISKSDSRGEEEEEEVPMLQFHNGIAQYQDTSTLRPTLYNVHIRNIRDANKVFYAVATGVLPLVTRPPYKTERPNIRPGNVYVWEAHGPGQIHSATSSAWQTRWKEGIHWEPGRPEGGLFWHFERGPTLELMPLYDTPEFERAPVETIAEEDLMVRQYYDVFATLPTIDGPRRPRQWILIAYYTRSTKNQLSTLDDLPWLMDPPFPEGDYRFRHIHVVVGRRRADVSASAGRQLAPLWDLARYSDREPLSLYRPLSEQYALNETADTED